MVTRSTFSSRPIPVSTQGRSSSAAWLTYGARLVVVIRAALRAISDGVSAEARRRTVAGDRGVDFGAPSNRMGVGRVEPGKSYPSTWTAREPMRKVRSLVVLAALAAWAAACGGGNDNSSSGPTSSEGPTATKQPAAAAQHPKALIGDVGKNDAFEISLTDDKGNPITNLKAGTYKLTINDESDIHNFHLTGGDLNDATSVGSTSDKTMTVTFKPGQYSFVCDPHRSQMSGGFTVS